MAYKKGPEYSPEPSPDGFFSEEGEEQEMSKGGGKDEGDLKRRLEGDILDDFVPHWDDSCAYGTDCVDCGRRFMWPQIGRAHV